MRRRGFTLIELLIVVAIIAILAAIAVPNFLEAQTRAKVSRVKADMRSMATALETYRIDYNVYPYDGYNYVMGTGLYDYGYWYVPIHVSTPTAYMTSVQLIDPFRAAVSGFGNHFQWMDVRFICTEATFGTIYDGLQGGSPVASMYLADVEEEFGAWRLNSAGPDMSYGPTGDSMTFPGGMPWDGVSDYPALPQPYDPTNGTVSWGDIQRSQKAPNGYVNTPG